MDKLQKGIILDKILLTFKGDVNYTWEEIHEEKYYRQIDDNFYVVENNIKFLLGENVLMRITRGDIGKTTIHSPRGVGLTDYGFAILTEIELLGYEAKAKVEKDKEMRDIAIFWITLIGLAVGAIALINQAC